MITLGYSLIVIMAVEIFSGSMEEQKNILIRVKNNSSYHLKKVEVSSSVNGVYFGDVAANQKSDYKIFPNAYATMAINAEIEGKNVRFLPDDYLGEQHLKPGKYTFTITVIEANGQKHLVPRSTIDKP